MASSVLANRCSSLTDGFPQPSSYILASPCDINFATHHRHGFGRFRFLDNSVRLNELRSSSAEDSLTALMPPKVLVFSQTQSSLHCPCFHSKSNDVLDRKAPPLLLHRIPEPKPKIILKKYSAVIQVYRSHLECRNRFPGGISALQYSFRWRSRYQSLFGR